MKYIDNDPKKGIEINWNKVKKELKKLNLPLHVYTPIVEPLYTCKYHFLLSERSVGKTTNLILLGMILYREYGIITHYIRTREEYITPKNIKDLMSVITSSDYDYISKITNKKWNSCFYHAKRWYYCNRDDDGKIIDQDEKHFMICMSIDQNDNYKSSYTCPVGDYIIYDEFISRYYYPDSFTLFLDLCKTIIRDRLSPIIILSANTINKQSLWFDEFGIKDTISKMKIGDSKIVETKKGTKMNIHILSINEIMKQNKSINNSLFFGFDNPKLSSITGEDWSMDSVQHIPNEKYEILSRNHYIKVSNELVRLSIVKFETLGIGVIVQNSTTTYDDSIIYTIDDLIDYRYRYGVGYTKLDRFIWQQYNRNKFYYATNEQGSIVESYLQLID